MMKRVLCSLALTGLLATGMAFAQDQAPATPPDASAAPQGNMGMHGHGKMMSSDQRLAHMTKKYKLTSDQQTQIKPILDDEQQQMTTMRSDTSMSRQDKMAKMKSMHQDDEQKISAVLTDDQRKLYDADQQKMQAKRADRMQNMQGGQGAAPPPPDGSAPPPPQQ